MAWECCRVLEGDIGKLHNAWLSLLVGPGCFVNDPSGANDRTGGTRVLDAMRARDVVTGRTRKSLCHAHRAMWR